MNLSQWESLPDEEILLLRAEIGGVARAHVMPPLQYRVAHADVTLTREDITVLRDWAHGDVTSKLGEPETTPAGAGAGNAGHGKQVFASRCSGCHTLEQHRGGPSWPECLAGQVVRRLDSSTLSHYRRRR
jgi:hypothetical protein